MHPSRREPMSRDTFLYADNLCFPAPLARKTPAKSLPSNLRDQSPGRENFHSSSSKREAADVSRSIAFSLCGREKMDRWRCSGRKIHEGSVNSIGSAWAPARFCIFNAPFEPTPRLIQFSFTSRGKKTQRPLFRVVIAAPIACPLQFANENLQNLVRGRFHVLRLNEKRFVSLSWFGSACFPPLVSISSALIRINFQPRRREGHVSASLGCNGTCACQLVSLPPRPCLAGKDGNFHALKITRVAPLKFGRLDDYYRKIFSHASPSKRSDWLDCRSTSTGKPMAGAILDARYARAQTAASIYTPDRQTNEHNATRRAPIASIVAASLFLIARCQLPG